jgi:hypothetical protein
MVSPCNIVESSNALVLCKELGWRSCLDTSLFPARIRHNYSRWRPKNVLSFFSLFSLYMLQKVTITFGLLLAPAIINIALNPYGL